jgi:hypothetical protein
MRITKLPIPLLIAAAALTSVAVIYVYLTAPPMPLHTDPNFTSSLYVGGTYLWRGAAFEYTFSSDEIVSISYMPPYHLIYANGPLSNFTIGSNVWIVYLRGGRPLYVVRHYVYQPWSNSWGYQYLAFKLVDVTPSDSPYPDLNMWLPQAFGDSEYLTNEEYNAVYSRVGIHQRVVGVEVNATHVIFRTNAPTYNGVEYRLPAMLSSPVSGRTIRVTNSPTSTSYTVNSTTLTAIALPYQYFAITPSATTTLTIYVN